MFLDASLAAEAAAAHVAQGADVLTGSGPLITGAISVAAQNNVRWFGNGADQSPAAPVQVVASQVYHWDVVLREVLADIDSGVHKGRALRADLSNGGLTIQVNPGFPLDPGLAARLNELVVGISSGSIVVPG